jgi:hypothetical protein
VTIPVISFSLCVVFLCVFLILEFQVRTSLSLTLTLSLRNTVLLVGRFFADFLYILVSLYHEERSSEMSLKRLLCAAHRRVAPSKLLITKDTMATKYLTGE